MLITAFLSIFVLFILRCTKKKCYHIDGFVYSCNLTVTNHYIRISKKNLSVSKRNKFLFELRMIQQHYGILVSVQGDN